MSMNDYIPEEIVAEMKKYDLLTYLQMTNPNELVHEGGENYCTKTHDSLKISNGKWHWFSRGLGGKSALNYIIAERGCNFKEAVNIMMNELHYHSGNYTRYEFKEPIKLCENEPKLENKQIVLPPKSDECKRVFAYLCSRGIDKNIISFCLKNHLIYEDTPYHNVVFLGYDENHQVKFGCVRSTNSKRFMHDLVGSSKEYSFRLLSDLPNKELHIFESAIDLLSYATLLKLDGEDYRKYNLISLSGVYQPAKNIEQSKVPVALQKYLESHNTQKIILHFDNDLAGKNAALAFQCALDNCYEIEIDTPVGVKDVNDVLCDRLGIKIQKNIERVM